MGRVRYWLRLVWAVACVVGALATLVLCAAASLGAVRLEAGTLAYLVLLCGLLALAGLVGLLEALALRQTARWPTREPLEPVTLPARVSLPQHQRPHQPRQHLRRVK